MECRGAKGEGDMEFLMSLKEVHGNIAAALGVIKKHRPGDKKLPLSRSFSKLSYRPTSYMWILVILTQFDYSFSYREQNYQIFWIQNPILCKLNLIFISGNNACVVVVVLTKESYY